MAVQDIALADVRLTPVTSTRCYPTTGGTARMGAENPQKTGDIARAADVNSDQEDNGAEMNLIYDPTPWRDWELTCKPPTAC